MDRVSKLVWDSRRQSQPAEAQLLSAEQSAERIAEVHNQLRRALAQEGETDVAPVSAPKRDMMAIIDLVHRASQALDTSEGRVRKLKARTEQALAEVTEKLRTAEASLNDAEDRARAAEVRAQEAEAQAQDAQEHLSRLCDLIGERFSSLLADTEPRPEAAGERRLPRADNAPLLRKA